MKEINKNTEINDTDKKLHISDVMGSLSRFEKFFRNEHPTMFYRVI